MKKNYIAIAVLLFTSAMRMDLFAQVTLTGNHYTETFDAIASGLPAGWSVTTNASATNAGAAVSFVTNATSWGTAAGQFANYASTTNNDGTPFTGTEAVGIQSAATNRSPGVRLTGTFGDPGAAFVVRLQNTLGFVNFQLRVDLNMLSVQGRSNVWTVDYAIGPSPSAFTPVGTYTDPGGFGTTNKTFTFGGALDNQSQTVWIRVVTLAASTGSGSRDTVGIDNFTLSYNPVSPVPLNIDLIGTNAVLTWTNPAFLLQTASAVAGPYTNVPGATSPYTNPASGPDQFFRLKAN